MSSRQPGYLVFISIMAVLTSAGQIVFGFMFAVEGYTTRRWPLPPVPGLSPTMSYGSRLTNSDFYKDQLILLKYGTQGKTSNGGLDWHYDWFDPETSQQTAADFTIAGDYPLMPVVYGDRLFFNSGTEWVEVIDGRSRPPLIIAAPGPLSSGNRFLLDRECAIVGVTYHQIRIMKLVGANWENDSLVSLPSGDHNWTIDGTSVSFQSVRAVQIVNDGDCLHLFVDVGGPILHRAGLNRRQIVGADRTGPMPAVPQLADEPVSALMAENAATATEGWSLVTPPGSPAGNHLPLLGMLVGGQPAVLLVTETGEASMSGLIRRYDGGTWSDFATIDFSFGSSLPQVHSTWDGQRAYVFGSTALGVPYGYRIDATGVRPVRMDDMGWEWNPVLSGLRAYVAIFALTTFLGVILGGTIWLAMRKWTTGGYQFGQQSVALASLGRRGIARLIDLLILGSTTVLLFAALSWGLDWQALAEALNLGVPHPTVALFTWDASIASVWLISLLVLLIVSQARWGVTPGKWCCGVRTLRATLQPCGIARSLAREVVLCVDTCNTLCWTPGILSIALTDHRQRLGDLVADTIVVEARSLRLRKDLA